MMTFPTHMFTLSDRPAPILSGTGQDGSGEQPHNRSNQTIVIRSHSPDDSEARARQLGLIDPVVITARPLRPHEQLQCVWDAVLDDPRIGHQWLPLFVALEDALGYEQEYPSFDLRFLPPHTDYHFTQERHNVRVVSSGQGATTVWISSREHTRTQPQIVNELEQEGWEPPTRRFHLGHSFSFDERPPLSEALRIGITAMAMFTPLPTDVFFEVLGLRPSHPYNLDGLHPVAFGDHTYFQIPGEEATIARRTKRLLSSPVDSHVYRRLTSEDRAAFIERNRKDHPDCATWSDDQILMWESGGA